MTRLIATIIIFAYFLAFAIGSLVGLGYYREAACVAAIPWAIAGVMIARERRDVLPRAEVRR